MDTFDMPTTTGQRMDTEQVHNKISRLREELDAVEQSLDAIGKALEVMGQAILDIEARPTISRLDEFAAAALTGILQNSDMMNALATEAEKRHLEPADTVAMACAAQARAMVRVLGEGQQDG